MLAETGWAVGLGAVLTVVGIPFKQAHFWLHYGHGLAAGLLAAYLGAGGAAAPLVAWIGLSHWRPIGPAAADGLIFALGSHALLRTSFAGPFPEDSRTAGAETAQRALEQATIQVASVLGRIARWLEAALTHTTERGVERYLERLGTADLCRLGERLANTDEPSDSVEPHHTAPRARGDRYDRWNVGERLRDLRFHPEDDGIRAQVRNYCQRSILDRHIFRPADLVGAEQDPVTQTEQPPWIARGPERAGFPPLSTVRLIRRGDGAAIMAQVLEWPHEHSDRALLLLPGEAGSARDLTGPVWANAVTTQGTSVWFDGHSRRPAPGTEGPRDALELYALQPLCRERGRRRAVRGPVHLTLALEEVGGPIRNGTTIDLSARGFRAALPQTVLEALDDRGQYTALIDLRSGPDLRSGIRAACAPVRVEPGSGTAGFRFIDLDQAAEQQIEHLVLGQLSGHGDG